MMAPVRANRAGVYFTSQSKPFFVAVRSIGYMTMTFAYNLKFGARRSPRSLTMGYQILLKHHPEIRQEVELIRRFLPESLSKEAQITHWQDWLRATQRDLRDAHRSKP